MKETHHGEGLSSESVQECALEDNSNGAYDNAEKDGQSDECTAKFEWIEEGARLSLYHPSKTFVTDKRLQ